MLEKSLNARGASVESIKPRAWKKYLSKIKLENQEALFKDIALGSILPNIAAAALQPKSKNENDPGGEEAISIAGSEGNAVSFGACCLPVPGDRIMAFVSADKGVVIHRGKCPNVREFRKHPDRCIDVTWAPITKGMFPVGIRVLTRNVPGVLANISASIGEAGSNIEAVEQPDTNPETATLLFEISVKDRDHMARADAAPETQPQCHEGQSNHMSKTPILTDNAPAAIGAYSQAMRHGDTVYLSGQIPLIPATMEMVTGDIDAEIRQVLDNLTAVCQAAGGSLNNIVRLTVYLTDLAHFGRVNEIMSEYFENPYPARAAIGVASLPKDARVEMDGVLGL